MANTDNSDNPVVIKVGGSLFDLPDLQDRLTRFLLSLDSKQIFLIPGGGATANVVRNWDRIHGLGEESAHWLALRSLSLNAHWLQLLLPDAQISTDLREKGWRIIDPFVFAQEDEGKQGALPHVWDATSDSVAARVAIVVGAARLVLLKSINIPKDVDWCEAVALGWVDPVFPSVLQQCHWPMTIQAVNLRSN